MGHRPCDISGGPTPILRRPAEDRLSPARPGSGHREAMAEGARGAP